MRTKLLTRRSRPRIAVSLLAAVLFAIVPAVQAYCGIDLPVRALAASVAVDDSDGDDHTACCDSFPGAALDERISPHDGAPLVGKPSVPAIAPPRGATAALFAAAPHRVWHDRSPPEPVFHRFPRLLL
jgi:hypothetical protein